LSSSSSKLLVAGSSNVSNTEAGWNKGYGDLPSQPLTSIFLVVESPHRFFRTIKGVGSEGRKAWMEGMVIAETSTMATASCLKLVIVMNSPATLRKAVKSRMVDDDDEEEEEEEEDANNDDGEVEEK